MAEKTKKYYLLTFNEDHGDEHDVPALDCKTEEEFESWKKHKQKLHAFLGNNSDYFMENDQHHTGEGLIKEKLVDVTEVNESFHKTFHKAGLSGLSLCSVFDNEDYDDDYNEDDE